MTSSDIVSISPIGVTSIVNSKMRRWLFQNLDPDTYQRSFIAKQQYFNEVWFCFPMSGSTSCSHAIVWNYRDNVFSVRELPSVSFAASGVADSAYPLSWASDTESWDSDLTNWNSNELTPKLQRVVMASPLSNQILLADSTSLSNGVPINGTLERTGITFGDPNKVKLIKGIRPKFYGVQSVFISAGSHNTPYGPVTWSSEVEYTIGSDYQADLFVSGRYLAFRIRSTNSTWRLERVDFDLEVTSDY
jgi:hypothetical protein